MTLTLHRRDPTLILVDFDGVDTEIPPTVPKAPVGDYLIPWCISLTFSHFRLISYFAHLSLFVILIQYFCWKYHFPNLPVLKNRIWTRLTYDGIVYVVFKTI